MGAGGALLICTSVQGEEKEKTTLPAASGQLAPDSCNTPRACAARSDLHVRLAVQVVHLVRVRGDVVQLIVLQAGARRIRDSELPFRSFGQFQFMEALGSPAAARAAPGHRQSSTLRRPSLCSPRIRSASCLRDREAPPTARASAALAAVVVPSCHMVEWSLKYVPTLRYSFRNGPARPVPLRPPRVLSRRP